MARKPALKKKVSYKVKNWPEYNRSLINRGNLTLWVSEEIIDSWFMKKHPKKKGRRFQYSDSCIETGLTLSRLFKLSLRSTQGFLEGLMQMTKLDLPVPHYSRFSRRSSKLIVAAPKQLSELKKLNLAIDSTGLKIYGEGEWKMRTHGKQKRRTWRKYHVAIDTDTHEVIAHELTQANVHDCNLVKDLLRGLTGQVDKVRADGAYTHKQCFDEIAKIRGDPIIPVRSGTCIVKEDPSEGEKLRNELIRQDRKYCTRKKWKKASGYHIRSLVETHMYRLKTILGGKLNSRLFENQKTETAIMTKILNLMTQQGMPQALKFEH